jgi:CDP-diacylglycerol--glycerol-3-phosphate 3-phosphatidyltransferase
MFDGRFRHVVDRGTAPVGAGLVRLGVTANVLTTVGLVVAAGAAVVIGTGYFAWGAVAMTATGLPDLFDGPVAKAAGTTSVRGAFLDSVADRVADALLYGGVAWYLAVHQPGPAAVLPFAIVAVAGLISYERAKAEVLGLPAKGGLMERAERFVVLGACLLAAAVDTAALVPALVVFLVLVTATAIGRFARVWRIAGAPHAAGVARGARLADLDGATDASAVAEGDGVVAGRTVAWRKGRVDSRWRAWRAARMHAVGGVGRVRSVSSARAGARTAGEAVRTRRRADGELSARWRSRRAGTPSSRVGRVWRERRAGRDRSRTSRWSSTGGR